MKQARLLAFHNWLNDHSRDVLDECDYILLVKTQLNYPGGPDVAVDGHPHRWLVAEGMLAQAAHQIPALQERFTKSIEVLEYRGSFPKVQFLGKDAEDALHDCILDDIWAGHAAFLGPMNSSSVWCKEILVDALTGQRFDGNLFSQAVSAFKDQWVSSKMLLVVRGLPVNRILILCLNRRWNVQYGLHQNRHLIAVPFEAKGIPSEQSEYGHQDFAILSTCLAFYYTGLTLAQFRQGLQHVLRSDDPAVQYECWVSSCDDLLDSLRHQGFINADDEAQLGELWKRLCLSRSVIDHYMNYFIFPVHAGQFEIKLQASAWDIPTLPKDGQHNARTTGFSGTNDNRAMLPLTVRQYDLPSL
jgi:hypothetical protein